MADREQKLSGQVAAPTGSSEFTGMRKDADDVHALVSSRLVVAAPRARVDMIPQALAGLLD